MDCSCSGAPTSDAGALDGGCLRCIDAIYLSIPAGDPRVCAGEQAIYKALRDCACQKCGAAGQACHQELCLPGLVGGDCEGCIASNCCAVEFKACNQ